MDLRPLLKPQSVAIVGVSSDSTAIGRKLLKALIDNRFGGRIFPINPEHEDVAGIKCYPSLSDINSKIDAVLVAVSGEAVLQVIEEAGRKKVRSAIIYPPGLFEPGAQAGPRQGQIASIAKKYDLVVCGPNSAGIVNFHDNIALSFLQVLDLPQLIPGNIGFVSQSGSLGEALINRAQNRAIGMSYFISTGNEEVLESSDYIEYLLDDSHTSVIVWLMEGLRNAEKFLRIADIASDKKKPIVVIKVARTAVGRKAANFHAGYRMGSDAVYEAIFRQKGIIRVAEPDELYVTASMLARNRFPKGNRIGIITDTIAGGVILLDKLVELGMVIPQLNPKTVRELSDTTAALNLVRNPLNLAPELINDTLIFSKSLELFARDENLDAVIVAISTAGGEQSKETASHIIKTAESLEKPMVTWWPGGSFSAPGMQMLEKSSVPFFTTPNQCAKALEASLRYSRFLESHKSEKATGISISPPVRRRIEMVLEGSERILTEDQGEEILSACGISVPSEELSKSLLEAIKIASEIGYPIALKSSLAR
jgi:acyl-CoA synthetase (NDP forming)